MKVIADGINRSAEGTLQEVEKGKVITAQLVQRALGHGGRVMKGAETIARTAV